MLISEILENTPVDEFMEPRVDTFTPDAQRGCAIGVLYKKEGGDMEVVKNTDRPTRIDTAFDFLVTEKGYDRADLLNISNAFEGFSLNYTQGIKTATAGRLRAIAKAKELGV